jgi:hypothetical protein
MGHRRRAHGLTHLHRISALKDPVHLHVTCALASSPRLRRAMQGYARLV